MSAARTAFDRAIHCVVSGDFAPYAALFAADAVVEWPFAPPGLPSRLEGADAIAQFVAASVARGRNVGRTRTGPHDLVIHELGDHRVIAELAVDVHTPDGAVQRQRYVHIITVDAAGKITSLRDYYGAATANLALATVATAR